MFTYAKLVSLLTLIACLASSCNSDTADDMRLSKGSEMLFSVSDISRASVAIGIDKFAVYGDIKVTTNKNTTSYIVLFNNQEVVYNDGKWTYDGVQYWVPQCEHSFVGVSPVSVLSAEADPTYINSKLSFTYSIPAPGGNLSGNDDVEDIMVSTHRRYYTSDKSLDNKISLSFGHILSLINIAPAFSDNSLSEDAYMLIHKLEISGVTTKARFDLFPAEILSNSQTDDMVVDVNALESGDLAIELPTPVKVENNAENVKLFSDNDAMIMLPQNFVDESNITVYYTINEETSMRQVVLPLSSLKWKSGNRYMYRFTIEMTGAIFNDCEINPWNVINGGEISVD